MQISEQGRRENNEDSFYDAVIKVDGKDVAIGCVCDGMGGLSNGKQASQRIREAVRDFVLKSGNIDGLDEELSRVSNEIYTNAQVQNMQSGTTCTVICCMDRAWKIYHIGDSRCFMYDVQKNQAYQLTTDHTALNAYAKKLEEMENADPQTDPLAEEKHRRAHLIRKNYKNKLTRCLGVQENPQMDVLTGSYRVGDRFLLCSDGFWHYLSPSDFNAGTIEDLGGLVEKFLAKGEGDNMTAVLITITD